MADPRAARPSDGGTQDDLSSTSLKGEDFYALANNLPTLCWMAHADGNIFWYNRRWYEYTGMSPESQAGWGWESVHDPQVLPDVITRWQHSIATGERFELTFPLRGRDGVFRPFLTRIEPQRNAQGEVVRWFGTNVDISAQVAAEKAMRVSETQFRNFAQSMANHVWTSPPDGMLDWFNARVYEYCGASPGELDGQAWAKIVHPDDLRNAAERWAASLASEETYQAEFRLRRADGLYRWHIARAVAIKGPDGATTRWIGTNTDIEEQKKSSEALEHLNESLERQVADRTRELSRTWDVSLDMLGILNLEGYFETSNPAWQIILGWSEEEIRKIKFFDFVHPDDLALTYMAWEEVHKGKPALRFENRFRRKDGTWRWLSWVAVPEGNKVYCSARDITSDKDQAAALAESTAARDRIWRISTDVMIIADFQSTVVDVNPAWTHVTGWTREQLVGRSFMDLVHPEDLAATLAEVGKLSEGAATFKFENRYRRRDGSYCILDWTAVPDGKYIHGIGRDVTQEREASEALARAEDALRQSQKMEAVGQLTGGIAHDFNNMLAVVIGSLDLLRRRLGDADERTVRYVSAANDAARRAAALTQRLLAFSRQQPLKPESIDANRLIAGMSDLLRRSLGSSIELKTVLAPDLWRVNADPNQLENVILNLAVNARDAMPDGGRLTVETQNAHLQGSYVASPSGVPAGEYVLIAVTDNGSGMMPEVIAKAFEPFFTTKDVGKGTGLGLSQVYGTVKQSGGHVKIYSEPGSGTTVKVYLPRLFGADAHDVEAGSSAEMVRGEEREVILVVEDEQAMRRLTLDALEQLGYRVLEADGASVALRLLESHPEIVLMFTDIVMPEVNGAKLAQAARKIRPDLKVLFTTGFTPNSVVQSGVVGPDVELLGKPFSIEDLASKVRDAIEAKAPT